jgi:hypothetical protein
MARYIYETATGKREQLEDYILSELGLEGIQATETPGKYVMLLFMGDGSILYDFESGKTPADIKKSKEQYQAFMLAQNKQMTETAERLCEEAQQDGTIDVITDEDGEAETEGPYSSPSTPVPEGMYR